MRRVERHRASDVLDLISDAVNTLHERVPPTVPLLTCPGRVSRRRHVFFSCLLKIADHDVHMHQSILLLSLANAPRAHAGGRAVAATPGGSHARRPWSTLNAPGEPS